MGIIFLSCGIILILSQLSLTVGVSFSCIGLLLAVFSLYQLRIKGIPDPSHTTIVWTELPAWKKMLIFAVVVIMLMLLFWTTKDSGSSEPIIGDLF